VLVCAALGGSAFSIPVGTADGPSRSTGDLAFFADLHQYEGSGDSTRVEVDLAVGLPPDSARLSGPHVFIVEMDADAPGKGPEHPGRGRFLSFHERNPVSADGFDAEDPILWCHRIRFDLLADSLVLRLAVRDSANGRSGEILKRTALRSYSDDLSVSDLFLASHVQKALGGGEFERQGLVLWPNPSRIFRATEESQFLFVYFEVNHMPFGADASSVYAATCAVTDSTGQALWSSRKTDIPKTGGSFARIEKIPLTGLKPGPARVCVEINDAGTGQRAKSGREFRIAAEKPAHALMIPMTEKDIRRYRDQLAVLSTPEERKLFDRLDPVGKQQFLLKFWKSKDPDPATPENEFMAEYFTRLAYCEERFKGGLRSDMARIVLKYGYPVDILRKADRREYRKPVEIWTYGIDGRTEFVFVDRLDDGQYVMIHSTHPDELHNPDWEESVK
jgi:GWxTD domain-containing protein